MGFEPWVLQGYFASGSTSRGRGGGGRTGSFWISWITAPAGERERGERGTRGPGGSQSDEKGSRRLKRLLVKASDDSSGGAQGPKWGGGEARTRPPRHALLSNPVRWRWGSRQAPFYRTEERYIRRHQMRGKFVHRQHQPQPEGEFLGEEPRQSRSLNCRLLCGADPFLRDRNRGTGTAECVREGDACLGGRPHAQPLFLALVATLRYASSRVSPGLEGTAPTKKRSSTVNSKGAFRAGKCKASEAISRISEKSRD